MGNTQSVAGQSFDEEVRHISSTDLLRWVKFVQKREKEGRVQIAGLLNWWQLEEAADCDHGEAGKDFYFRLEKAVVEAFVETPGVESEDLWAVLNKVPDPPPGCGPLPDSESGEFYEYRGGKMAFVSCPLRPMAIRSSLTKIAQALSRNDSWLLDKAFEKGSG